MKAVIAKKTLHELVVERCPTEGNYVKFIEEHNIRVRRYDTNATTKLTPEQKYEYLSHFFSNVDGLNDVDDKATMFTVATGTAISPYRHE